MATKMMKSMQGGMDAGQLMGDRQPFAAPMTGPGGYPPNVKGMQSLQNDIGEMSGFQTTGYIDKKGTPYGEAAKFNYLPPGMDITNQEMTDQRPMPMRKLVAESYPGDGWMPTPRDIPE